jgi:hypothetical protein
VLSGTRTTVVAACALLAGLTAPAGAQASETDSATIEAQTRIGSGYWDGQISADGRFFVTTDDDQLIRHRLTRKSIKKAVHSKSSRALKKAEYSTTVLHPDGKFAYVFAHGFGRRWTIEIARIDKSRPKFVRSYDFSAAGGARSRLADAVITPDGERLLLQLRDDIVSLDLSRPGKPKVHAVLDGGLGDVPGIQAPLALSPDGSTLLTAVADDGPLGTVRFAVWGSDDAGDLTLTGVRETMIDAEAETDSPPRLTEILTDAGSAYLQVEEATDDAPVTSVVRVALEDGSKLSTLPGAFKGSNEELAALDTAYDRVIGLRNRRWSGAEPPRDNELSLFWTDAALGSISQDRRFARVTTTPVVSHAGPSKDKVYLTVRDGRRTRLLAVRLPSSPGANPS